MLTRSPAEACRRSWPPPSTAVCGRPARSSVPIPASPARSLLAAAVLGDAGAVREMLTADPAAAVAIDDERGWPPLLYACYSRWHQIDPDRAPGMAEVVRVLLDAGASPNTNDGGRPRYRSALKGSVEVNNPDITEVLLDAGASPDPGQPIAEAVGHRDHRCLRLLLAHGARVAGTWAIGAAVYNDDPVAMSLLLDALDTGGGGAAGAATEELPDAAATPRCLSSPPFSTPEPTPTPPMKTACRRCAWQSGPARTTPRHGCGPPAPPMTAPTSTGSSAPASAPTAVPPSQLLADHPDLQDRLTDQDRAVIVDAAAPARPRRSPSCSTSASPPTPANSASSPCTPPPTAGTRRWSGCSSTPAPTSTPATPAFDGTPLAFATVGSGEQAGKPGDWVETVATADRGRRLPTRRVDLREATQRGGHRPPAALWHHPRRTGRLNSRRPGGGARRDRHRASWPTSPDTSKPPTVTSTSTCSGRSCTRRSSGPESAATARRCSTGTGDSSPTEPCATVNSVEVDRDAVVLGLTLTRKAEGARPAPPQQLYQVFTVDDAQIVDIRGYPDRRSALTRAPLERP